MTENVAMPAEPYFYEQEERLGFWWNQYYAMQIRFSADNFEEFSQHFQHMADVLSTWQIVRKGKAKVLELEVLAHPWISQRILQRLKADPGLEHVYGDFCRYGTVKLHLFDPFDLAGQHIVLYEKVKSLNQ